MKLLRPIKKRLEAWRERLNQRLSSPDALLQSALLGLIVGVLSGLVIVAFRWIIEFTQGLFLPGEGVESFEQLAWELRFSLPILSGLLIGLLYQLVLKGDYLVGILHVVVRLAYHQGQMGWKKFAMQFVGAALAIIGGHSVGREAPSVHLGASAGALLGQQMELPNNSVRMLIGCGSAAAISASFNTPLAGVIFAMEVVMLEYTIASFLPVILASVSAASISILAFGNQPIFSIPPIAFNSLAELPFVALLGVLAGIASTIQIKSTNIIASKFNHWPFVAKTTFAGLIAGICGLAFPQILGVGYDTVNSVLIGEFGLFLLVGILSVKMVATAAAIGLGVPAGVIGPTLFMGAMLGGSVGFVAVLAMPDRVSDAGMYALLGMGAMMAATLQAPLAALIAILELTNVPSIIFPGMLVIVIAELTRSELFHQPSVFKSLLIARGLDYSANPLALALRRIGVASQMSRSYVVTQAEIGVERARELLSDEPYWILIAKDKTPTTLMSAVFLARYIEEAPEEPVINLLDIPADRHAIEGIHKRASLYEAEKMLRQSSVGVLYVFDVPAPNLTRVKGIITRDQIESAYRV